MTEQRAGKCIAKLASMYVDVIDTIEVELPNDFWEEFERNLAELLYAHHLKNMAELVLTKRTR